VFPLSLRGISVRLRRIHVILTACACVSQQSRIFMWLSTVHITGAGITASLAVLSSSSDGGVLLTFKSLDARLYV